ncbi:MAG: ABC transporter ATP-binding protein [Gammaproteobacteria bacterium]|nr:ABC transporter ATP-binding protein [Gammaproteobacteria bacterium]
MSTIVTLVRAYPGRSLVMLLALIVAGIAEGFSLTTLLPLVSLAAGEDQGSGLSRSVVEVLRALHVTPTIGPLLAVIVLGIVIKSALILLANRQVGYTVAHVATDLRVELIDALLHSEWRYYLRQRAGSLANTIATEAYRAATGFEYAARGLAFAVQALVNIVVALLISWQATVVSTCFGVLSLILLNRLLRVARHTGQQQTALMRDLLTDMTDVLGIVKAIKAMGRDRAADALLKRQSHDLEDATRRQIMSTEALRALQEPLLATLAAIGLYIALTRMGLQLSEVMVLVFLLVRLLGLVNKVQRQYQLVLTQESAYWSIRGAARAARDAAEQVHGTREAHLERAIRLHDVGFRYQDAWVLTRLDVVIPARALTVLRAPSGAGKSTLLDILCGLLRPQQGRVLIDDVPLDDIDLARWRRGIGYVPQEPVLLHDSVRSNVLVGAPELGDADARAALAAAGALDFVEALPGGLDHVVGERGGQLSGGQRQRIAIARALAERPQLLILDEPTSALDAQTAAVIRTTLRELARDHTVIVATHHPDLVAVADHVVDLAPAPVGPE